jgi:hypothetical protein
VFGQKVALGGHQHSAGRVSRHDIVGDLLVHAAAGLDLNCTDNAMYRTISFGLLPLQQQRQQGQAETLLWRENVCACFQLANFPNFRSNRHTHTVTGQDFDDFDHVRNKQDIMPPPPSWASLREYEKV